MTLTMKPIMPTITKPMPVRRATLVNSFCGRRAGSEGEGRTQQRVSAQAAVGRRRGGGWAVGRQQRCCCVRARSEIQLMPLYCCSAG